MGSLAVIGLGLIGTSVCMAARRAWPDITITGLDRGDSLDGLAGVETIVLATPVATIIDLIQQHSASFGDAVVIDTGSTKHAIVDAARRAGLANFVGGHPMSGAASTGPAHARMDLFDDRPWFLVPAAYDDAVVERARTFVERLGAKPIVMADDGTEHDYLMAAVSHLPQVVASTLMRNVGDAVGPAGLKLSGAGLRDTTRLAGSSADMWGSVLATNATELRPLLVAIADDLRHLADKLNDEATIRQLFEAANRYRDQLK